MQTVLTPVIAVAPTLAPLASSVPLPPLPPAAWRAPAARSNAGGQLLGAILVDAGKLTVEDTERVMRLKQTQAMRFGAAAIALGLLKQGDIEHALARQFDFPYLIEGESLVSKELVAAYAPFSPQVEALRGLRSQLMLRWFAANPRRRALAIVSPGRGEGRSYMAANLAIVFSQLGERTLLIDANLRQPRQHSLFGLDNEHGLSAILAGHGALSHPQRVPQLANLAVLTAGATPPNPQELLGRTSFAHMLEHFGQDHDVILIDTPAGSEYADAQGLACQAGGALLVTRRHHSNLKNAGQLCENLRELGVQLVGSVFGQF